MHGVQAFVHATVAQASLLSYSRQTQPHPLTPPRSQELPAHLTAAAKAGDAQNNGVRTNNVTGEEMAEKRTQLQAIAADPDVYEKLAASLAPSIWQLDDVKKGLLCQLFGGVSKVRACLCGGGGAGALDARTVL